MANLHHKLLIGLLLINQTVNVIASEKALTQFGGSQPGPATLEANNQSYFSSAVNWVTSWFTRQSSAPHKPSQTTIKFQQPASPVLTNALKKKFGSISEEIKIHAQALEEITELLPELVAIVLEYDHPFAGRCKSTLLGHSGSIATLLALPNGILISASTDATIKIWDPSKSLGFECIRTLCGHRKKINSVALLADGKLISTSDDRTIKIWDLSKYLGTECVQTILVNENISSLIALQNEIIMTSENKILIKKISSNSDRLDTIRSIKDNLTFYPNSILVWRNNLLVSMSGNLNCDAIKIWCCGNSEGRECIQASYEDHEDHGYEGGRPLHQNKPLAILSDEVLAAGTDTNNIKIWKVQYTPNEIDIKGHSGRVTALAVTPNNMLISGSEDCTIKVWSPAKGYQCLYNLLGHKSRITAIVPLNGMIASADSGGTIKIWE